MTVIPDEADEELSSDSPWGTYADLYDLEFDEAWTSKDLPFYLNEARQRPSVLELASGTGRLAIPLAEAGISVVGLDASGDMLRLTREKAPELQNLKLVEGKMQDFQLDQTFELVIIALGTFYDLRTIEDQEQTLRTIRRHLKPHGRLLIDLFLPTVEYVGRPVTHQQRVDLSHRTQVGQFTHPVTGFTYHVSEAAHHVPHEQTFTMHRVIETFDSTGKVVGEDRYFRICGRYVHRYEMLHLLRLCGYDELSLYGDYNYAPFDASSRRMIWVASTPS